MNTPLNVIVRDEEPVSDSRALIQVIERAASNPSINVENMERLLAMQERIFERNAEIAFNEDMQLVQQQMPAIVRDAENTSTNSRYTRLETLNRRIVPIYTQHGFSLSFGTADSPLVGHYRITCVVAHRGGHSRNYQCDVPADTTGMKGNQNKTATHGFGSTMSYGRRYLTLLIFNISLVNEDSDATGPRDTDNAPPPEFAEWWADTCAAASSGTFALTARWGAAPKGCRPYVTANYLADWEALKRSAAEVDKKATI